jgi:hypothetical protein
VTETPVFAAVNAARIAASPPPTIKTSVLSDSLQVNIPILVSPSCCFVLISIDSERIIFFISVS